MADESGLAWRTSSYSGGNNECVEVAEPSGGGLLVRDSTDRSGPVLRFTAERWTAFLRGARAGGTG